MKTTSSRIAISVIGLGVVLSCVTQQKAAHSRSDGSPRYPAATFSGGYGYDIYYDRSPEATVTCQEFFELLKQADPKPTTIQSALEILKRDKPKFFSRYVLLPNSLSLHESSHEHPRAVVYGGDGRTVVTFNGDPKQRGYGHMELMCFNQSDATFEFREITFPQEAKDEIDELTTQQKMEAFVVSPVNGSGNRDCRQCHQTPARPNWDTYARWPSSFGAIDDSLFRTGFREQYMEAGSFDHNYTDAELAAWQKFARKGRYSVLEENATDRPNLTAGKLFGLLNAERIVAELKRLGSRFERVKGAFAEALYCPTNGIEYKQFMVQQGSGGYGASLNVLISPVDPEVKKISIASGSYSNAKVHRLTGNFKTAVPQDFLQSDELQTEIAKHYISLGFSERDAYFAVNSDVETNIRLANLSKVVKPIGIDIENWSMVVNGGYDHEDGSGGELGSSFAQILDKPFLDTFFSKDAALIELVQKRRDYASGKKERTTIIKEESEICKHLKARYR